MGDELLIDVIQHSGRLAYIAALMRIKLRVIAIYMAAAAPLSETSPTTIPQRPSGSAKIS